MRINVIAHLQLLFSVSEAVFCPGATGDFSTVCNSDILGFPVAFMPYSMITPELISYSAVPNPGNVGALAATISFQTPTPILVRIWDSWVCGDYFQIELSNTLFPLKFPENTLLFCPIFTPTATPMAAFKSPLYAWTEFILDEPTTWSLRIWVFRGNPDSEIPVIGDIVQQLIETLPYNRTSTQCPFL